MERAGAAPPSTRTRVPFAHRAEHAALSGLFALFRVLGVDASSALAGGFCRLVGPAVGRVHARGAENLRRLYPDLSDKARRTILADAWENLGRTTAEFAHLDAFDPFAANGRLAVDGADRLRAIADGAGPVIFVSGHLANWELMALTLHRAGVDHAVVYRPANNASVDAMIQRRRLAVMSPYFLPKTKSAARGLVEALRAGRSLAMLVDQKMNDGISAPFMGLPAMTAPAPARLSLKFAAPIVPIAIRRGVGARFVLTIREPIEFEPSGEQDADVRALTTRINEAIADEIHAAPGQWLWFHRRWPASVATDAATPSP
ncbi:MAG: lysophospholipid acyltransferase family protein [Pseudomonadota bacterium]